jgi:hypothetical protein
MRSRPIGAGQSILASQNNDKRDDARGASFLLAHQQLGALALGTNPSNNQVVPIVVNGTTITVTFVTSIASNPNNVLIGASAAASVANLIGFLRRPDVTSSTQIAASSANQSLLQYVGWSLPGSSTNIVPFSLNKNVNGLTGPLSSFNITGITVTSGTWTAQTMQLYVEDGTYYINGTRYLSTGGSTPTVTAPASNPRIDVLTIDTSGTPAWTTGAENASPVAPTYPANKVPICELYNVVSETALYDNENQQASQGYISNDVRPTVQLGVPFGALPDDIIPDVTNTRSLGNNSIQWLNIYGENIYNNGALVAASKFGGTGADGALSISSGTTTINCSNAAVVVKNYTSISITGTGALAFSNPHANGTIVILKSQGAVTITSSATPAIDLRSMGAGISASGQGLIAGPQAGYIQGITIVGGNSTPGFYYTGKGVHNASAVNGKGVNVFAGSGGASGSSPGTPGTGGLGGGGLYIECAGALNFTGNIKADGAAATNGSGTGGASNAYGGLGGSSQTEASQPSISGGSNTNAAGGGGGGGGSVCILYNSLTANSGTVTVTGGAHGTGSGANGTDGSAGWSLIQQNTEFA